MSNTGGRSLAITVLCDVRDEPEWLGRQLRPHLDARTTATVTSMPLDDPQSLEQAQAIFTWRRAPAPLRSVLDRAPQLKWIHVSSAGLDGVPVAEIARRGITLTSSRGVLAESIADHAITQLLALCKRMPEALASQGRREWKQQTSRSLQSMTLAIVGFGAIGAAAARRAHAFGMRVLGVSRRASASPWAEAVVNHGELQEVLAQADAVLVAAPQTPATRGLIGAAALDRLRPGALVINVSRAAIVDEGALLDRLISGRLGGAALDVHWAEPLPGDSPWWGAPNTLLTAHVAAMSEGWDARLLAHFGRNLRRYLNGEALVAVVDPAVGY